MNLANFVLLVVLNLLCGHALLSLFKIRHINFLQRISLSILLGLGLSSFIPMLLEILGIAITASSVLAGQFILSVLPVCLSFRLIFKDIKQIQLRTASIKVYDILAVACIVLLLYTGAYKCYFWPPTPRDLTSGAEGLAEFAVKEGHIMNSFLLQDLSTTNNHQKPPSVLGLQIIYKLLVHNFGQVWLIVVSYSFYLFLYGSLRQIAHPVFAGLFSILSIAVPEMYAYTIMPLFDFSNTVYVTAALVFLFKYLTEHRLGSLYISSILFAIAVFFRAETLLLVICICIFSGLYYFKKHKQTAFKIWLKQALTLCFISAVVYMVSMEYFIRTLLQINFDAGANFTSDIFNLTPFFTRLYAIFSQLIFNYDANSLYNTRALYNDSFAIFFAFIIVELFWCGIKKKADGKMLFWLYGFFGVIIFLAFIGYLIPLVDLNNTTKRGLFKLIPIGYLFIANTSVIQWCSNKLTCWENKTIKKNNHLISATLNKG